jgi:hypothetical protein
VAKVGALLRTPFMPHQRLIADVANEVVLEEDGSWGWRYTTVIVTIMRQAGKTTTLGATNAHRAMTMPDHRCWYTAQTGLAAVDVWTEWQERFQDTMPGRWKFRLSAGQQTARWPATRSFIRVFPPTPESLHSKAADDVELDEVWKYTKEQGGAITQAVGPTQATRPRRQLWIVSTAGTEESIWFRSWVERGRIATTVPESRICFIEYAAPYDLPWDDPATWAAWHPAYGRTIGHDFMVDQIDILGGEAGFRRAMLNQWPRTETDWRQVWDGFASTDRIPADCRRLVLAADANPTHQSASIVAAALLDDGRVAGEVVDHRPGVLWLRDRLVELAKKHRARVVLQEAGPLAFMVDELKRAGVRLQLLNAGEFAQTAAQLPQLVTAGLVTHPLGEHGPDPLLSAAVENVVLAASGDRFVWRRRDSTVPVNPIVAFAMAAWRVMRPPTRRGAGGI